MILAQTALLASPAQTLPGVESVTAETRPTHTLRADFGLFSAIGSVGVVYSFQPVPQILLELGSGLGGSGLQVSAMPKLVLGASPHRFTPGLGISLGVPTSGLGLKSVSDSTKRVAIPWLNADLLAYDYRSATGFSFAVAAGLTMALGHGCIVIDSCTDVYEVPFPQVRLGFGQWF